MGKQSTQPLLILLCAVLTVIFTFLLTLTVLLWQPGSAVAAINAEAAALSADGALSYPVSGAPAAETEGVVQILSAAKPQSSLSPIGGQDSGIINILMIGHDQKEGNAPCRSDCMILCTFHKNSNQVTMTSILRDLYVSIPGHDSNRINASYALGGMELLKQTLKENLGLHIDGCVEVDFSRFSRIIDLLGGVTLELRQDEALRINKSVPGNLTEGANHLTGDQALAYTRIRNLDEDGDFSRTNRQRKVIHALLASYKETDILNALSIAAKVVPMLSTDMEYTRVISTIVDVLPILPGCTVVSQRIPADGMYTYSTIRNMSVLTADMNELNQYLAKTLLP